MSKKKIDKKFDSIVDFSGIKEFIDTPIKRYSSGMCVRLGFSTAIHTDAEILLVDEVLAVGDATFQRKCLNKMSEFRNQGKTVILVSHNLHTVETFCQNGIYLRDAAIVKTGNIIDVLNAYYDEIRHRQLPAEDIISITWPEDIASGEVTIEDVVLLDSQGQQVDTIVTGQPVIIRIHYYSKISIHQPRFGFSVWAVEPTINKSFRVFTIHTMMDRFDVQSISGKGAIECEIKSLPLLPGKYHIRAGIYDTNAQMPYCLWGWGENKCSFLVSSKEKGEFILKDSLGVIDLDGRWRIAKQ